MDATPPSIGPWKADAPAIFVGACVRGKGRAGDKTSTASDWCFLCLCEVGNFSELRRHLGKARAEQLAIDVAGRIAQVLPDARLAVAGHNLVEVAFEGDDPSVLTRAIGALEEAFASLADFEHERHSVRMLFGASAVRAAGCDEVRLVEEAEAALAAIRAGDTAKVRDLSAQAPAITRSTLTAELPRALVDSQLFLQFQPKLHLRRQEVVGVEALIRWQHPERGLILPSDFIPSAEASRHIGPLTLWTLRQVIADQKTLAAAGHDVPVFINISGQLLSDGPFVAEAGLLVRDADAKIGFEITETAVIRDPDAAIYNLQRFADLGVPIAIDDYGAGLSSLAYLKRLPASELKIDKLFVSQLSSSHRDPLIVRSTIDLAHALEMEVTAEGIENPATLALLTVMGCDMGQGYLISRPLGFDALRQFLDDDEHLETAGNPRGMFGGLAAAWQRG